MDKLVVDLFTLHQCVSLGSSFLVEYSRRAYVGK